MGGPAKRRTGFGVVLEAEHDFGRAVPPRRDVLGHVPGILLGIDREATREAEIANLQLAVGIDEQVARLEVAVQHVRRVYVLQTAEDLVDERLEMSIGEGLPGSNDSRKVAFHQLCNRAHVSKQAPLQGKD